MDKRAVHDLYRILEQRGGRDGGPLSRTTVRMVHRVLVKAFADLGVQLDGVRKPRPAERETMGRKGVWTPAECSQFLDHHSEHRLRAAWVLAIIAGLRRGELAGLKWNRVDLDRGRLARALAAHRHQHRGRREGTEGQEQTGDRPRPRRRRGTAGAQRDRRTRRRRAGVVYHDGDYVFCREDGQPYYPTYFTDQWSARLRGGDSTRHRAARRTAHVGDDRR